MYYYVGAVIIVRQIKQRETLFSLQLVEHM